FPTERQRASLSVIPGMVRRRTADLAAFASNVPAARLSRLLWGIPGERFAVRRLHSSTRHKPDQSSAPRGAVLTRTARSGFGLHKARLARHCARPAAAHTGTVHSTCLDLVPLATAGGAGRLNFCERAADLAVLLTGPLEQGT